MKLTVAVPTFRRPGMLGDCIASLLPQLRDGVEVLVVDNDPAGSARGQVDSYVHPQLRYVHEPKAGVVRARNRAVAESAGRYLAFIDDDEIAGPGWVAALLRHVEMNVAASFGRVVPRFLSPVEPGLEALLEDLYTRDLRRAADDDISGRWSYVGTGNSLFDKAACFPEPDPFSAHLNATGGEDVWLVKALVERGLVMRWNPEAVVEEQVAADRATLAYAQSRRLSQGQQRVILVRGAGGAKGWARTALWMGIGAAQYALHGGRALALRAAGKPRWRAEAVRASGGLGKILWWKLWDRTSYAGGAVDG
jgi:succinoglycan biosynthesis protein ExoM